MNISPVGAVVFICLMILCCCLFALVAVSASRDGMRDAVAFNLVLAAICGMMVCFVAAHVLSESIPF